MNGGIVMKYCPFCGSGLQEAMVFCPKCGKRFLDAFENPEAVDLEQLCEETAEPIQTMAAPPISDDAIEKTEEIASDTSQVPKKKSKKAVWLAVVLLVIVGGVVGFFCMGGFDDAVSITDAANSVLYLEVCDDTDYVIATASGFIIEDGTTLVTNYHVIDGAHHIIAYTPDGESSNEIHTVLAYDKDADLAVLKCEDNIGVPSLLLGDSDAVNQGDEVFAVGYPLGVANTLSDGVVSSRYLDEYGTDILQITAAISSGSSGGALFSGDGQVIGVICASYIDGQNLNIAISSNTLSHLLEKQTPTKLEDFFTPTYSVSYVIENQKTLLNKEFYVVGWVSAYGYADYAKEGYDSNLVNGWANIYNTSEDVPYDSRPKDDVYESNHYRDKYITVYCDPWGGPCEALEQVDTGDCLLVKGEITLEYAEFSDGVSMNCSEFLIIN